MPLVDYLGVLRRRGWIIPVVAIVAALSAYGFARLQTSVYRSSVRLQVSGRFAHSMLLGLRMLYRYLSLKRARFLQNLTSAL